MEFVCSAVRLGRQSGKRGSWPVSRVLYPAPFRSGLARIQTRPEWCEAMVIPLGRRLPVGSSGLPRSNAGLQRACRGRTSPPPLFGLAPGGVCRASRSPDCWCALTAPFHPYLIPVIYRAIGGVLSVALSLASRPVGVTHHRVLWSPDFPLPVRFAAGVPWQRCHQAERRATIRPTPKGLYATAVPNLTLALVLVSWIANQLKHRPTDWGLPDCRFGSLVTVMLADLANASERSFRHDDDFAIASAV